MFDTIRECREYAESYGTTADYCLIYDRKDRLVAEHRRNPNGDGTNWFRSTVQYLKDDDLPLAMRLSAGLYRTRGGFEIVHDNGDGGTGEWVVVKYPDGDDNPLAFCSTLKDARRFIRDQIASVQ